MPPIHNTEEEKTTAATTTAATETFKYSTCVRSFSLLCVFFHFISFSFCSRMNHLSFERYDGEKSLSSSSSSSSYNLYLLTLQNDLSPQTNETTSSSSRINNSALEFPFATKEKGEIVFNSIHVDPPINTSRTTKDLRLEEKIIRAKITAIDARSLRSAVVGLIDSIALVVETVERCER
jgi:tRNA threonylcarbamoyladenosine modification (KEOPS) complex  Pcc1 subunit